MACTMTDGLYRLFCGTRPFDWLMFGVDFAAFLVGSAALFCLVLFEGSQWNRHRKAAKRIKPIQPLLDKGRHLLNSIPETDNWVQWIFDVEQWNDETATALYLISPSVCSAFTLTPDLASAESVIHRGYGLPIRLEGDTRDTYQRLQIRLENLRKIVAKPEDYLQ
jgi:hypothetical protein